MTYEPRVYFFLYLCIFVFIYFTNLYSFLCRLQTSVSRRFFVCCLYPPVRCYQDHGYASEGVVPGP